MAKKTIAMINNTICFVAGKSGGHIIPCLTIAQQRKAINPELKALFFSANTPLDKAILSHNTHINWHIMLPLSRLIPSFIGYIITTFKALSSFVCSFFYLFKYKPTELITTGGIVAIPVCCAAFILRIPITLYSLDAVPGKAIQLLTPLAQSIYVCFKNAARFFPLQKCFFAPYPIKYDHTQTVIDKTTARTTLGLTLHKKTILLLGGSQGSLFINECIKKWIDDSSFSAATMQIIHQTGSVDATDWKKLYQSKTITSHVFSYYPDLAPMYVAADLIICRAGAGTLFEIKFFNKHCIIIPLATNTTDHQVDNARAMSHDYPDQFTYIMQTDVEKNPALLYTAILQHIQNERD
jgi:UDP-N-acetylglucosamine--N-acetylmuramyl-(pentapeptide) pyrophosphoryl-undecaprenol N-acetylglucosamine transferase